jgi:hypothetical protein
MSLRSPPISTFSKLKTVIAIKIPLSDFVKVVLEKRNPHPLCLQKGNLMSSDARTHLWGK